MKNLIKAIETEQKNRLEDFIFEINAVTDFKGLDTWKYNDLMPKSKKISLYEMQCKVVGGLDALKSYLISRKQKAIYKSIEREVNKVKAVYSSGKLLEVKISVEWKRSQMWGSNPSAECWASFINKDGNHDSIYVTSGSIGGCGYDKLSTSVANCLNQVNAVLKPLYHLKDEQLAISEKKNHDILGYGSGYGILPSIEGGVGVSCYPAIFNKIGMDFKNIASGKTFDVFTITAKTA